MSPVDVLIPTYNPHPAHLREALESLKKQTFQDWTAFIHDDCSDVDTRAIIEPYLADPRFRFAKSAKRLGIGGNWNACVRQTSAPVIAFLFQDDIWQPEYLARAMEIFRQNPTVGFVSMEHDYLFDGQVPSPSYYEQIRNARKTLAAGFHEGHAMFRWWLARELHPNIVGEPSFVVMKREALAKAGPFLEDMPQALDMEAWMRMLLVTDWYDDRDHSYGSFRVHANGASARNALGGHGLFDRLRCFEIMIARLHGHDRKDAIAARNKSINTMVAKYFGRMKSGAKVTGHGSGRLKKFCLRHPLLILRAVIAYLFS